METFVASIVATTGLALIGRKAPKTMRHFVELASGHCTSTIANSREETVYLVQPFKMVQASWWV